jgi:ParB-like chromosome segregation protein Spo0J
MPKRKLEVAWRGVDELIPHANNARTHSAAQIAQIAASIKEFGWTNPVLTDADNGIIAGHGRVLAARALGYESVPCIELSHLSAAQKRAYVIADNRLAENAGWDDELLALELGALREQDFDLELTGFDAEALAALLDGEDDDGGGADAPGASASLADRFLIAPFSVLDGRRGWWRDRKAAWLARGIDSGAGRADNLVFSGSSQPGVAYKAKNAYEAEVGRTVTWAEFEAARPDVYKLTSTSIFDPVLCELAYLWFCPPGATVLDPFAGGSVRGITAALLGRSYVGCDLSEKQVEANRAQWAALDAPDTRAPAWHCGDSTNLGAHTGAVTADFVFSCPPYASLERYSDDPADLSTMAYPAFVAAYRAVIEQAIAQLKPDRFAVFVVGEVRDNTGHYVGFVADTIAAFEAAGARYYNEAVFITPAASLPIRAGKPFATARKLGKTHQNVLVFIKGDAKRATAACGAIEVEDLLAEAVGQGGAAGGLERLEIGA